MGANNKLQGKYIRVDFTTTAERKDWLLRTAAHQEISVSQLLNRLIRNRMKNQERFSKKDTTQVDTEVEDQEEESKPLTREKLRQMYPDEDL